MSIYIGTEFGYTSFASHDSIRRLAFLDTYSFIHSFIHSFNHPFIYSTIASDKYAIYLENNSSTPWDQYYGHNQTIAIRLDLDILT